MHYRLMFGLQMFCPRTVYHVILDVLFSFTGAIKHFLIMNVSLFLAQTIICVDTEPVLVSLCFLTTTTYQWHRRREAKTYQTREFIPMTSTMMQPRRARFHPLYHLNLIRLTLYNRMTLHRKNYWHGMQEQLSNTGCRAHLTMKESGLAPDHLHLCTARKRSKSLSNPRKKTYG